MTDYFEPWAPATPLDDPTGPPFPVALLPDLMRDVVEAIAEETQTPADLPATMILAAISAAVGSKYNVYVGQHDWSEILTVYQATFLQSASRKSQVIRWLSRPIAQYERDVNKSEKRAQADYMSRMRVLEQQLAQVEKEASKIDPVDGNSDSDLRRRAAVDEIEQHKQTRPVVTQTLVDDSTPEATKSLMAEQHGQAAVLTAEATWFHVMLGRYSDSPNLDVILSAHSADPMFINRRGRDRETIERPCLTLGFAIQPDIMRTLGGHRGFITHGAAARFLYSFPEDNLGYRKIDTKPVQDNLRVAYDEVIISHLERRIRVHDGVIEPWLITLDDEANAALRDYRTVHEANMGPMGMYADIRNWAGKLPGAVLRIAGLLHAFENPLPESKQISKLTIDRAIGIGDYFTEHARIAFRMMSQERGHETARKLLEAIRTMDSPVSKRDLQRKVQGRAAFLIEDSGRKRFSTELLTDTLQTLEDHGFIRIFKTESGGAGRPSEIIELNPYEMPDVPAKIDKISNPWRSEAQEVPAKIDKMQIETRSMQWGSHD